MVERIEKWILATAPVVALVATPISLWAIFYWVPMDKNLGLSQRIFYYHVPCAIICYLCFAIAGIAGAAFLKTRNTNWDHAGHASVSLGLMFGTLVLVTGSIWAKTAWGAWWTWDARLTTFLVLWLVFASYGLLRAFAGENEMAPRYAAVLALAGALNIPLVQMATRLWRTIHPQVIANPQGGIDDPRMSAALGLSMLTMFAIGAWLWALKLRMLRLDEHAEILLEDRFRSGIARGTS